MQLIKSMLLVFSKIILFGLGLLLLLGGGSCALTFFPETGKLDLNSFLLFLLMLAIAYIGWIIMFAAVSVLSSDTNTTAIKTENDNPDEDIH